MRQEEPPYESPKHEELAGLKAQANQLYFRMKTARYNDHLIDASRFEAELEDVGVQITALEKELGLSQSS